MTTQPQAARQVTQDGGFRRWFFANAVLDERTFALQIDGREVEIERKPFEVLRFLLQHSGEVVTKDELLAAVWPGRFLSETVLTKCVGRLREVLRDDAQAVIKTVYKYGYRLMVPVRVEVQRAPDAARFDFKPGDRPPGRPLWSLVRRLGAGGHGEAWLGQHDKTREQRVFKFADSERSLAALKREITLFRVLHDSVGEQARIVELLDWNLEQEPCFIECRYVAGGSLADWAARNGGLARIPLPVRLDIAARVADAVAAVHSVGVLHKDLKPSNILVEETVGETPSIRLADFGSGGVLDTSRLEQMGITRLGFTKTLAANQLNAGTPLYLAPELLNGQAPTVKSDIYALGAITYQLVAGEFRKAMSPGWEHDVRDELLRECIAHASQGDAERRLGDAATLALRLRTLDEERERRRRKREAEEKAEAYERAHAAAVASEAVAQFLSKDLFSVVTAKPLRDLTVRELLDAASEKLADRFADMPLAAAQIHAALGNALVTTEAFTQAERHLERSLELYEQLGDSGADGAIAVAAQLIPVKRILGTLGEVARYAALLERGGARGQHPAVSSLRQSLGSARLLAGDFSGAAEDFRTLARDAEQVAEPDDKAVAEARRFLGQALLFAGEFDAAEQALAEAVRRHASSAASSPMAAVAARLLHGQALLELERFDDAERALSGVLQAIQAWVVDDSNSQVLAARFGLAQLALRQDQTGSAIDKLEQILAAMTAASWNQQVDNTAEPRRWLAQAYLESERFAEAEPMMRGALESAERMFGRATPWYQAAQVGLADALRVQGRIAESCAVLASIDPAALSRAGADHPLTAELRRVEGLIAMIEGRSQDARGALAEALRIFERRYGPGHKLSRRARSELSKCSAGTSVGSR